ncbi:YdcF family protein [Heyndrickxia sporothermodurans]
MKISELDENNLTDEMMTRLLYKNISDDKKNGECIFVPGSSKAVLHRLPKAVELYKQGRAKKILFSGGVIWDGSDLCEAQLLREKAIELGVPEIDILFETSSQHTKENVLASLLVLDREFDLQNIKRLIVVTTIYHMRRMYLNLLTYMPSWVQYSLCSVNDNTTREDNWFLTPYGRSRVETESKKLITYVKQGALVDFEI